MSISLYVKNSTITRLNHYMVIIKKREKKKTSTSDKFIVCSTNWLVPRDPSSKTIQAETNHERSGSQDATRPKSNYFGGKRTHYKGTWLIFFFFLGGLVCRKSLKLTETEKHGNK